jgi:Cu(I)/Ag(I) efflux system protein CusF
VCQVAPLAGKATLHHGSTKKINMDESITIGFNVKEFIIPKQLNVGDRLDFEADRVISQLTVIRMR